MAADDFGRFRVRIYPPDDPETGKPREVVAFSRKGRRMRIHKDAVRQAKHLFGAQPGTELPNATVVTERLQPDQQLGAAIPRLASRQLTL